MSEGTKLPTVWEHAQSRGVSRRDFIKACTWLTAMMGLPASALSRVVEALETKPRLPVVWFHFQECTCCSESFIKSNHPIVSELILDKISLDYTETLMAAAGKQAEDALHETMKKYLGSYVMLVEGAVPLADDGVYCCIGGRTAHDIIREAAAGAKAVIAWGSCASNGCIQGASPNPTRATQVDRVIAGKPVINVAGCPPIGEVMTGTVAHILAFDRLPQLDGLNRPKAFYSRRIHDTCYRRPNYDAGLFVEAFDDDNARRGYCLYKMGCRGPVTYNACGVTRWNEGVSYPIQSGHPCIGCSEPNYWDNGPLYQHLASFPGFGIETTADTIGLWAAGVGGAAVVVHAIATNLRKRGKIKETIEKSEDVPGEHHSEGEK